MKSWFLFLRVCAVSVAGACVLDACTRGRELPDAFVEGQQVTIGVSIREEADGPLGGGETASAVSRRVHGDNTTKSTVRLLWADGDRIRVTVGGASSVFTLVSGTGTTGGVFTGTMPAAGSVFTVDYPATETDLHEQTYVANSFADGLIPMHGTGTLSSGTQSGEIEIVATAGVLVLQMTGSETVGRVEVYDRQAKETYRLVCESGAGLNSQTATAFSWVLPAGALEGGMVVSVYDAQGVKVDEKSSSNTDGKLTIAAHEVVQMPALALSRMTTGIFHVSDTRTVQLMQGDRTAAGFASPQWVEGDYWPRSTDLPEGWTLMTHCEWEYLLGHHTHGVASIVYDEYTLAHGLIILPDGVTTGITAGFAEGWETNTLTMGQWIKLQRQGAVFLPAGGYKQNGQVAMKNSAGYYPILSDGHVDGANIMTFGQTGVSYVKWEDTGRAYCLRPAKEINQ